MPNKNYLRGVAIERKCRQELEDQGYYVIRSAGSRGITDLIAIDFNGIRLIQIKRRKYKKSGVIFTRDENVKNLELLQVPVNCRKEVWVWRDRKGWSKRTLDV